MSPLWMRRINLLTFCGLFLFVIYVVTFVAFLHWQISMESMTSSSEPEGVHYVDEKTTEAQPNIYRRSKSHLHVRRHDNKNSNVVSKLSLSTCDRQSELSENSSFVFSDSHSYKSSTSSSVETPMLPYCEQTPRGDAANTNYFQQVTSRHYVYSAYYDDRSSSLPAVIRIIAMLQSPNYVSGSGGSEKTSKLYCHTWSDGGGHHSSMLEYYEMCENHGKQYGGWILTCRVPVADRSQRVPCIVGISTNPSADQSSDLITMTVFRTTPRRIDDGGKFAICVPPLFGHVTSKTLTEFIELTRLIGADHLVFYYGRQTDSRLNDTVHEALTETLEYYRQAGIVSVINWTLPEALTTTSSTTTTNNDQQRYRSAATTYNNGPVWYHGQLLAINDCLYRTMHAFERVAFNDIDEFIVPRHRNVRLDQVLADVDRRNKTSYCAYSFRSAFFDPMSPLTSSTSNVADQQPVVYELESDVRTMSFSLVRTKVVIDPQRVFELGIHHVSKPLNDEHCPIAHVDPSDVIIHHYRQCIADFDVHLDCSRQCMDDSLVRSGRIPILRQRVERTIRQIAGKRLNLTDSRFLAL